MEEVHYGGKGPHWAVVLMKNNEKLSINPVLIHVLLEFVLFLTLLKSLF